MRPDPEVTRLTRALAARAGNPEAVDALLDAHRAEHGPDITAHAYRQALAHVFGDCITQATTSTPVPVAIEKKD